ncbi:MAG: efflux RND transporter periplasmic adaptor subunit [Verrucomicrobiales bacterium]|nr:efflux RND transporter periplasmic adaptor subunit [Verrucomicrobiales bacterium]
MPVIALVVQARDIPSYVQNIGETRGSQDVEIRARVAGFLHSIHFQEGRPVREGDLLYTIDDQPFRANLQQAEALLAQATAAWQKAQRDTNRLGPLKERRAISGQQFDDALAAERSAAASAQAAGAGVSNALIQLGYTRILAPISGVAGKTEVKPGNLVGQGQNTLLTTVSTLDPVHVRFSVSEQEYLGWRRRHPQDAPGQDRERDTFELVLADGVLHPHRGSIVFGDREVDAATGTFLLEASFPNPGNVIRPGQFARVRYAREVFTNSIPVPQRAVQELQATYAVYTVTPESKAEFRKVTLGPRVGDWYVVTSGLRPGETVVVDGIQKLQNGVPVSALVTNLVLETAPASRPAQP